MRIALFTFSPGWQAVIVFPIVMTNISLHRGISLKFIILISVNGFEKRHATWDIILNSLFSEGKFHFVFEDHTFFCEGQPSLQILCSWAYIAHPTENTII